MKVTANFNAIGKYLDQPAVVKNAARSATPLLIASAGLYGAYDTWKAPKQEKKKKLIMNLSILSLTVASSIVAIKGLKVDGRQILKGLIHSDEPHKHLNHGHSCPHGHSEIDHIVDIVNDSKLVKSTKDKLAEILEKLEHKEYLKLKEVSFLKKHLKEISPKENLIDKAIPNGHEHSPFEEIKDLSVLGLLPVVGGIAGGMLGDKITGENSKIKNKNRLKEGFYQYAANIVLCNVGAGASLAAMNAAGVKSKAAKAVGMIGGILAVGVLGGNAIANFISKNVFNPFIDFGARRGFTQLKENFHSGKAFRNLNEERHPEAIDVCLHVDDFATVGFLSGLKWIGPFLPALYSISGYRAGIGYRNGHSHNHDENCSDYFKNAVSRSASSR